MTEKKDKITEESSVETTEAPIKEPQRKTSREEYAGSVCGATVVPVTFETGRGLRHKCPECGKFMKP